MQTRKQQTRRRQRAATSAELAFLLPTLILLVLICIDFGRFAYTQVAVNNAARAGASYAIMNPYVSSGQTTWQGQIQQTARDEMTNQTGYDPNALTTATVVTVEQSGIRRVRVTASYASFRTIVRWPGIPSSLTLRGTVEMTAIR